MYGVVLLGCVGSLVVLIWGSLNLRAPSHDAVATKRDGPLEEKAPTVRVTNAEERPPSEPWPELLTLNPIRVEVSGRDSVWHFRYPGQDGEFQTPDDICSAEELHLPMETDITLLITSEDFLYTWLVPQLKLRKIAVPELTHPLEFRTAAPATYELPVDPMCGRRLFHDGPMGKMVIQSRSEFTAWLTASR